MMSIVAGICGVTDPYADLPRLTRWWQQMQTDPVSAAFVAEYQNAFGAFMASRR